MTDRDRATRDRLAEALATAQARPHAAIPVPDGLYPSEIAAIADALLPVVAELVREGQAEALEEIAVDAKLPGIFPSTQRWLLDRARALRAPRTEGACAACGDTDCPGPGGRHQPAIPTRFVAAPPDDDGIGW